MSKVITSKLEQAEEVLKLLNAAAYSVLCESNGVSDNEWKVENGVAVPEWPVDSFYKAIKNLSNAYSAAEDYLHPSEGAKKAKWSDACATASFIVDKLKEAKDSDAEPFNLILSSLHRNIADAINGGLVQTADDRASGKQPETMEDKLQALVDSGKLFPILNKTK